MRYLSFILLWWLLVGSAGAEALGERIDRFISPAPTQGDSMGWSCLDKRTESCTGAPLGTLMLRPKSQ